jgi:hypothetical protein
MRTILLILLGSVIFFSACYNDNRNLNANLNSNRSSANTNQLLSPKIEQIRPQSPPDPNFQACNLFFPLKPGTERKYTLQYTSGLVADVTVIVDEAEENGQQVFIERTQIVDKSGGFEKNELSTRKYVCEGGRIKILAEKTVNQIQEQATVFEHTFRNVPYVIVDPVAFEKKGSTWSYSFTQTITQPNQLPVKPTDPVVIDCEMQGEEEVKVPAGTFKTLKLVKKIKENVVTENYVKGLGLVKRASKDGTFWELKEYSALQPDPKSVVEK